MWSELWLCRLPCRSRHFNTPITELIQPKSRTSAQDVCRTVFNAVVRSRSKITRRHESRTATLFQNVERQKRQSRRTVAGGFTGERDNVGSTTDEREKKTRRLSIPCNQRLCQNAIGDARTVGQRSSDERRQRTLQQPRYMLARVEHSRRTPVG